MLDTMWKVTTVQWLEVLCLWLVDVPCTGVMLTTQCTPTPQFWTSINSHQFLLGFWLASCLVGLWSKPVSFPVNIAWDNLIIILVKSELTLHPARLLGFSGLDNKCTIYPVSVEETNPASKKKVTATHISYVSCCKFFNSDNQVHTRFIASDFTLDIMPPQL